MKNLRKSVEIGHGISENTSTKFQEIADASIMNLELSKDIQVMTTRQSENIREIVTRATAVVVIAEECATGTEEASSASLQLAEGMTQHNEKSQGLKQMAERLQKQLRRFKLHGENDAPMRVTSKSEVLEYP